MALRTQTTAILLALLTGMGHLSGCGDAPPPPPPAVKHMVLFQAPGWKGVAVVNGIPIGLIGGGQGGIPITEWTQTGNNEVAVVVQNDPNVIEPFQFQMATYSAQDASDIKALTQAVVVSPPPEGQAGAGMVSFQAPPREDWPWQRAMPVAELTDQDQREIQVVFDRYCNAYKTRNVEELLNVMSTRAAIKGRAIGLKPEDARRNDATELQRLLAAHNEVFVIESTQALVRPFGKGVIIYPMTLDGSLHLIYINNKINPNESFAIDSFTLCKIDGQWVQVN